MLADPAEIFRSDFRAECTERALVLTAVGIASVVTIDAGQCVLLVEAADHARALDELVSYERERRPPPTPPPPIALHPHAWLGCLLYALVVVGVALATGNGWWRPDAFDLGQLDAGRIQHGEWWRAWTCLTLHVDGEHLAANLAAGCWFGYLAARLIGVGHAWGLTVVGAGIANLIEALLGPASHLSVGASTAVFTALGLLSAYAWRQPGRTTQRWASRWAPLVGGVVLLGWTGSGGDNAAQVDVVAHVLGFGVGVGLGVLAARAAAQRLLARCPQWLSGLLALAILGTAWGRALIS